jgi:hypothetical protein
LVFETASSLMFLSQGALADSMIHTVVGTLSMLPPAHYISDKIFQRLVRDPVADLAMQEAWQMNQRR